MIVNENAIKAMYPNNPSLVREIVDLFVVVVPEQMENLKQAIQEKDVKQTAFYAHSLKGMFGNLALEPLQDLCLQLEKMGRNESIDGAEMLFGRVSDMVEEVMKELGTLSADCCAEPRGSG